MKSNMICLLFVEHTILDVPDKQDIKDNIKRLEVSSGEHRHKFGLRDEGEVGGFLGIRIDKTVNHYSI